MGDFHSHKEVEARKVHKCELCRNQINVKEKYIRSAGVSSGDFYNNALHITCDYILDDYLNENDDSEFSWDEVMDWLRDKYCYKCGEEEECVLNVYKCKKITKNFEQGVDLNG